MSFYPGQHVVCVKAGRHWPSFVKEGHVYLVEDVEPPLYTYCRAPAYLVLAGAPLNGAGEPYSYDCRSFRPLDERRLDVFRSMLAPTPKQKVEA